MEKMKYLTIVVFQRLKKTLKISKLKKPLSRSVKNSLFKLLTHDIKNKINHMSWNK